MANGLLLGQVLYYGLLRERRSLAQIFAADFAHAPLAGPPASASAKQPVP